MTNSNQTPLNNYVPVLKTKKEAAKEALSKIKDERENGQSIAVRCRYQKINIAVGKHFRFGQVNLVAGLSGHFKSTFLNIFLQDFKNKKINPIADNLIEVHHCWEMNPSDELIREVANKTKKSFLYVLSSDFNIETGNFNKLDQQEYLVYEKLLKEVEDDGIYYFEQPTLAINVIKNVQYSIQTWQRDNNTKVIPKIVVSIDHTLLVELAPKETLADAMFTLAKVCIYLKKIYNALVLLIGQLNNEIEKPDRIKNLGGHYPKKSDIYWQAQLYNACDTVAVCHVPEKLGIIEYGKGKHKTEGIIHFLFLKNRFGKQKSVFFHNDLDNGILIQK